MGKHVLEYKGYEYIASPSVPKLIIIAMVAFSNDPANTLKPTCFVVNFLTLNTNNVIIKKSFTIMRRINAEHV